eukprot:maker-scaffold_3-snap-gene-21.10-mRNA-1 protein AED:0.00 eAED:0.00 QI:46/1/1/1/1/1/3/184/259
MSKFVSLDDLKKKQEEDRKKKLGKNENSDENDTSEFYNGGAGNQGGSGTAVEANNEDIIARASNDTKALESAPVAETTAKITLFKNGFKVDDGPFRPADDPKNAEFLKLLSQGVTPAELHRDGMHVDVALENRIIEVCDEFVAYTGEGNALGGTVDPANVIDPREDVEIKQTEDKQDKGKKTRVLIQFPGGRPQKLELFERSSLRELIRMINEKKLIGEKYVIKVPTRKKNPYITKGEYDESLKDAKIANTKIILEKAG